MKEKLFERYIFIQHISFLVSWLS